MDGVAMSEVYRRACAYSEDSDQPAQSRSLIWIFTMRLLDSQGCKISSYGQVRLWSDGVDAQAELSLRWEHMSKGEFSRVEVWMYRINEYDWWDGGSSVFIVVCNWAAVIQMLFVMICNFYIFWQTHPR